MEKKCQDGKNTLKTTIYNIFIMSKHKLFVAVILILLAAATSFLFIADSSNTEKDMDVHNGTGVYCNFNQVYVETNYSTGKVDSSGDSYGCVSKEWLYSNPRNQ